jgi:hypothetical protein
MSPSLAKACRASVPVLLAVHLFGYVPRAGFYVSAIVVIRFMQLLAPSQTFSFVRQCLPGRPTGDERQRRMHQARKQQATPHRTRIDKVYI